MQQNSTIDRQYPSDPKSRRDSSVPRSLHGMAAVFGEIDWFDAAKEEWPQNYERLGHIFETNGIKDEDKIGLFFSSVMFML